MYAERQTITVTTDSSGDGTSYSTVFTGRIETIRFVNTDLASTVDFTITLEATGETVWSQSNVSGSTTVAPRQATHSTAGVAALYAAAGTVVNDGIIAVQDRLKIVVAQGGNTKTGTFHLVYS